MFRVQSASAVVACAATVGLLTFGLAPGTGGTAATTGPTTTGGGATSLDLPLTQTTALRVVGVSDGEAFWTADGGPLEAGAFEIPPWSLPLTEGLRRTFVKLELTGELPTGDVPEELAEQVEAAVRGRFNLQLDPMFAGSLNIVAADDGRSCVVVRDVPTYAAAIDVRLRVAPTGWVQHRPVPTESAPGVEDFLTGEVIPGGGVILSPIGGLRDPNRLPFKNGQQGRPTRSFISVTANPGSATVVPVFKDWEGKTYATRGDNRLSSGPQSTRTFFANLPPDDIQSVILLTRPTWLIDVNLAGAPGNEGEHGAPPDGHAAAAKHDGDAALIGCPGRDGANAILHHSGRSGSRRFARLGRPAAEDGGEGGERGDALEGDLDDGEHGRGEEQAAEAPDRAEEHQAEQDGDGREAERVAHELGGEDVADAELDDERDREGEDLGGEAEGGLEDDDGQREERGDDAADVGDEVWG